MEIHLPCCKVLLKPPLQAGWHSALEDRCRGGCIPSTPLRVKAGNKPAMMVLEVAMEDVAGRGMAQPIAASRSQRHVHWAQCILKAAEPSMRGSLSKQALDLLSEGASFRH